VQWASLTTPSLTDPEVASYKVRENLLGGSVSEVKVFDECRADQRHVSIVGHAGTGKTSSIRHYSALRGLPMVTLECDIALDETQTEGTYIPTGNGNELAWAYSALATAVRQPSVILLNELSRLAPKNASLFLSLLAERKLIIGQRQGEVITVHPECLIVADMNPLGYSGVSKQDQALLDRFRFNVTYEYDLDIDRIWCKSETFLREVVQRWRTSQQADPSATPFSHRLTEAFSWTASKFGLKPAVLQLLERFQPAEREALKLSLTSSSIEIATELGIDHDNIHTSL
jgi:MoxR-like ATPase